MASAPASEMILFIGAALAAGVVAIALSGIAQQYATGLKDRSAGLSAQMESSVALVNDPSLVPNGPVVLYVLNTGSVPIHVTTLAVLVDGVQATNLTVTVGGVSAQEIAPQHVGAVTLTGLTLASGDHHAQVITATHAQARLEFTV